MTADLFSSDSNSVDMPQLLSLKAASQWASNYLKRTIDPSNIAYLIQYGQLRKATSGGNISVDLAELKQYYDRLAERQSKWRTSLGDDLNWQLSFDQLREKETTKHVHRLHPYKGKFIPQLVEYFIDSHCDEFKTKAFFQQGDIVLDPFCGSGTTLVQANESGLHSIGIDVSAFNCMVAKAKVARYSLPSITNHLDRILGLLAQDPMQENLFAFDLELSTLIKDFNCRFFPSPDYKYRIEHGLIQEANYSSERFQQFMEQYLDLHKRHTVQIEPHESDGFLNSWYCTSIINEIKLIAAYIEPLVDSNEKSMLQVILSRTLRSCRATTHFDLGTLKNPQFTPYYCTKHNKICKPLFSLRGWFERYGFDAVERVRQFAQLRTSSEFAILQGDSRRIDLAQSLAGQNPALANIFGVQKIRGVFSSPPYVGQIDYHEQHAYAYELFKITRHDEDEIGPLFRGKGKAAQQSYCDGIAKVLNNIKPYLCEDYDIFLVANDKHNLYPQIAAQAGMEIVNQFKRPVLNRSEGDKSPYAEIIFHLKGLK